VDDNVSKVFEAMGAGALDAVNTPALDSPRGIGWLEPVASSELVIPRGEPGNFEGAKALLAKIETIGRLLGLWNRRSGRSDGTSAEYSTGRGPVGGRKSDATAIRRPREVRHDQLVAIGASAGGPAALAQVLSALPADFPAAVAIVQHVDEQFARGLASWLSGHTPLRVLLAEEGDRLRAGTVFLAAREEHLVLASPTHLGYTRHPVECSYQPSVDVFFKSVERNWQGRVVAILLTGMGRDGADGLKALRDRGHHTIAQDQSTSAVFGMPKAAMELDAATEILALDKIGPRLTNMLHEGKAESRK
jgi:two-component system response regulator WspF